MRHVASLFCSLLMGFTDESYEEMQLHCSAD